MGGSEKPELEAALNYIEDAILKSNCSLINLETLVYNPAYHLNTDAL